MAAALGRQLNTILACIEVSREALLYAHRRAATAATPCALGRRGEAMIGRSAAFRKACRVLGVDPATAVEDIACRYHTVAQSLRAEARSNAPTAAAKLADVNGAWGRIKYESMKCRARLTMEAREDRGLVARCTWPCPPTVQSRAFAGCELRPTEHGRCYRVLKDGRLPLILDRHPDDQRLLFARNELGRVVRVNGIELWTDIEGEVRPVR